VGAYQALEAAAVDCGKTDGGVEINKTEDVKEIFVDQHLGAIAAPTVKEGVTVKCNLAEATLANIALAWGQPLSAVNGSTFNIGGKTDIYDYRTIYINVKGPGPGTRKYTIHKAKIKGDSSQKYTKDNVTMVPVEITAICDITKTAGEQFMSSVDTGLDSTPPTVALQTPADGGTVVKATLGTVVWLVTEVNGVDWNTVKYGSTFLILNTTVAASAAPVAGAITYDASAKTVTFTPSGVWVASDIMQAMVTTGFKDAAGNALAATKVEQFSVTA
jgi:hypothetical protein